MPSLFIGRTCRLTVSIMAATMDVASAAANGDLLAVKSLINRSADVNKISRDGMTALAVAAFWGYSEIVEFLLQNGADVNACNKGTLWTAVHCAAFQGHGKVLMKLMEYEPDLSAKDSQGRTAVDFASALDSIWPIFAAARCRRTSKADLIKLDIVKKVTQDPSAVPLPSADLAHFSRPGSAYVIKAQPYRQMDQNMAIASANGDVLAGADEGLSYGRSQQPHLAVWNH